jgi:primosomal protein N' (replication factor Y) (superfamily II helicase)
MVECGSISKIFLQIAIAVPVDRLFDYLPPDASNFEIIKQGCRVVVPFRNSKKVGIVVAIRNFSELNTGRLKKVDRILDEKPFLSEADMKLLEWASHYYHHPLGEVLAAAFPAILRQGKPALSPSVHYFALSDLGEKTLPEQLKRSSKQKALFELFHARKAAISSMELDAFKPALKSLLEKGFVTDVQQIPVSQVVVHASTHQANDEQQVAIDTINRDLHRFSVFLLEGVTGSGKTEVYMQVMAEVLRMGRQVLILLPEINLTPQLEQRFRLRFALPIVSFHSKLTDKQRMHAWLSMQNGEAAIMLGTRSALFTPLRNPGLIILDEEHDTSFKQQDGFRFSARDVAVAMAKNLSIPIVLGSATPSLESLLNVERRGFRLLYLSKRAGDATPPCFKVFDIRNKKMQAGFSEQLLAEMRLTLVDGQQILLFLNRRGYAPVQICHACGSVSRCRNCEANMVIHAKDAKLRCHHCGYEQHLPKVCPLCKQGELEALGIGTERIEQTLATLFPGKSIVRLDRDTTQRKGALENYLQQILCGDADIILGTQMLAKGHHFPKVTLVAILDIDSGLFSVDYRAAEKLAQLIVQVAGRAGRADKRGQVILQTRHPQHPLLERLLNGGYRDFALAALQERQTAMLPPYSYQVLFRAESAEAEAPQTFLLALAAMIAPVNSGTVDVFGPVSAPMSRRAGVFRFQLLLQSRARKSLHDLLDKILPSISELKPNKRLRWSIDVDPVDLY